MQVGRRLDHGLAPGQRGRLGWLSDWRTRNRHGKSRFPALEKGHQRPGDLGRRLEPIFRLLGHHSGDDGGELGRYIGTQPIERPGILQLVGLKDLEEAGTREGGTSLEKVIESAAQAVDIRPDIGVWALRVCSGAM